MHTADLMALLYGHVCLLTIQYDAEYIYMLRVDGDISINNGDG